MKQTWQELAAQTWVLPRPGTTVRGAFDRLIQDNIGRSALSFVEVTSVHFGLALVLQSDMLAALPLHLVRWCAEDLKVAARIPIRQQSLEWPICATRCANPASGDRACIGARGISRRENARGMRAMCCRRTARPSPTRLPPGVRPECRLSPRR